MKYTCYNCGKEKECPCCGTEVWIEGITWESEDFSYELQERLAYYGECCECGSIRVEQ